MWYIVVTGLSYLFDHGAFPVIISMTVQPNDHISLNLPTFYYLITSGAIQLAVPFMLSQSLVLAINFADPKSASLQIPLLSIKIFAPLISLKHIIKNYLCITLLAWRNSRPVNIYLVYILIKFSLNDPYFYTRLAIVPPATNSMKILMQSFYFLLPIYLTILIWLNCFSNSISI